MAKRTCSIEGCERSCHARGWCGAHYRRWLVNGSTDDRPSSEERFWAKVNVDGLGGCWLWTASLNKYGYARFKSGFHVTGHRFAYELLVGPIPKGLQLDHLCRVRHCVNPDHLEPVTNHENLLRGLTLPAINAAKTHCPQGHPYSGHNLLLRGGGRGCRECRRSKAERDRRRDRQRGTAMNDPTPTEENRIA